MMTMSARASLLASSVAAHLVLFGAAAVDPASAQDPAPVANHTAAEADPIDTSITTQRPSHFRRELKAHESKKSTITHPSGISGDHRRTLMRGTKVGVVRNAIGQPVHQTSIDIRGAEVKASERTHVDGTLKDASPAGNGGTEAGGTDPHRQGFVPLRAGWAAPRDPRLNTAMNHSIISGRDIVHPGAGSGALGGPAKNLAGVINGTSFRPRHP
jgi:hypothetical protein